MFRVQRVHALFMPATNTTLTDARATDIALALTMEFGEPVVTAIDGDEVALSWELGHGGGLSVHVFGDHVTSACIAQDELRTPVRVARGSANGDALARLCRRAVDRWLAARA